MYKFDVFSARKGSFIFLPKGSTNKKKLSTTQVACMSSWDAMLQNYAHMHFKIARPSSAELCTHALLDS